MKKEYLGKHLLRRHDAEQVNLRKSNIIFCLNMIVLGVAHIITMQGQSLSS